MTPYKPQNRTLIENSGYHTNTCLLNKKSPKRVVLKKDEAAESSPPPQAGGGAVLFKVHDLYNIGDYNQINSLLTQDKTMIRILYYFS